MFRWRYWYLYIDVPHLYRRRWRICRIERNCGSVDLYNGRRAVYETSLIRQEIWMYGRSRPGQGSIAVRLWPLRPYCTGARRPASLAASRRCYVLCHHKSRPPQFQFLHSRFYGDCRLFLPQNRVRCGWPPLEPRLKLHNDLPPHPRVKCHATRLCCLLFSVLRFR